MRIHRPVTQRQCWWLLATALCALAPLAQQIPVWLAGAVAATLLLRALITWRQWRLPPRWQLVPITLGGAGLVLWEYRTLLGRVPGVALLSVLLALKLLELRVARDALTVVLLAYFLVLAHFMFDQSIPAGLMALATVILTTATLAAANDDRPLPAWLLKRSALLLLQGLPFMLALFILFPRIDGPLWGLPQDRQSATTGLSDTMTPGSIAELVQSDAVAFRVRFDGPPPEQSLLYWRGPVLNEFDGRSWRVDLRAQSPLRTQLPYVIEADASDTVRYELTLEPHGQNWLLGLEMPDRLPPDATLTSDMQFVSRQPIRTRLRYQQIARPVQRFGADATPRELASSLALPGKGNPRIRAQASQWRLDASKVSVGETALDAAIVAQAEQFFLKQLLSYTLTPPLLGADAIDEFVFDSRKGFCEHFASAFAFALRAAGVPARVVTGYQGGEFNPVDGYLVVRQYDAHAWTEVWLQGRGWVRIDPTAITLPRRIADNFASVAPAGEAVPLFARADLAWLRTLRNRLDAVTNGWNQWILGYNAARQRDFLQSLGFPQPDWQLMTAFLAGICGTLMLALTGWILWQRQQTDPAMRLWQNFASKLARRGVVWHPWEGPIEFTLRAARQLPETASAIQAIGQRYALLRYAASDAASRTQQLRELRKAIRTL